MIEKMSFINITGPIKKLDEFVVKMILPYEVELVNALTIVDKVKGIDKFSDVNPYREPINNINKIKDILGITLKMKDGFCYDKGELEDITKEIEESYLKIKEKKDKLSALNKEIEIKENLKNQIIPIKNIQVDIQEFFDFDYLKFRFGFMPIQQFEKIAVYEKEMELIVYETSRTKELVYLMYFMPRSKRTEIDELFASMHFSRIRISDDIIGYPAEAFDQLVKEIENLEQQKQEINDYFDEFIKENREHLDEIYTYLTKLNNVFGVRDLAIKTEEAFYLTGWIETKELDAFREDINKIDSVVLIMEDEDGFADLKPPTKLKNPKLFKPFEVLVNMYGIPTYGEIDPTIFVTICYVLFFGVMFGDVGQGFVIFALSFWLYKKGKGDVILIGSYIGVSSMIFGFVYGSVFGNEEIIPKLLGYTPVRPMESMMDVLITTTVLGIVLLVIAMILNMINLFRQGKFGKLLTGKNGVAGVVFYLSVLGTAYLLYKKVEINLLLVIILIVAPLIVIILSEPLSKIIDKNKNRNKEHSSSVIELIFEIIEMLLGFLSNTLSFLRVGAFALNHVGFFLAFHMLSDIVAKSSGSVGKVLVMIFGNILIIVLEGMIVAIQAMRLTYYELFSRFYQGDGKQFKPYKIEKES